jgi:NTP pyrophosphatase (non-canonical NTP hydrolase)
VRRLAERPFAAHTAPAEETSTVPDATTTVAELRAGMARFVREREWEQFHSPKNLAMALAAEAAELMEHFLWIDNDASRAAVADPARRDEVADELADVAGVVFALCNALDVDLSDAVTRKMAKNILKYPVEKCRGHYRVED